MFKKKQPILIPGSAKTSVILLLIAEAVAVTIPVILLGRYFNFPDILREPAEKAFSLFRDNRSQIISGYYIFLLSSLLYIPLSYYLARLYHTPANNYLVKALTGLGIVTAAFQSIGFVRWIFTMPYLTETYFTQQENRQTVTIVYEMLNRYAGMSIGEHLGFIAMGSWTIILGVIIIKDKTSKKWLGYAGCFIGLLLAVSVAEHFGGRSAGIFGTINFVANTLWTFWLIAIAVKNSKRVGE